MFKVFAITLPKIAIFLSNAKELSINFERVRYIFIQFILLFVSYVCQAQVNAPATKSLPADTTSLELDTLQVAGDSLITDSTLVKTDSLQVPPKGDIETTINYSAKDSMRVSFDGKLIWLYGSAKIVYGEIQLEAEEIEIDYAKNTLTAHGIRDSLGQRVGYPIFKNGNELYETKDIVYNFKTKKARISEVVTEQDGAIISANTIFKNEKNELLSIHNAYTTCNLEHPHFVIRSTKTKAIPGDKIVSGPFYFEFNDIPLPIGFAFGMFPVQRESKSGLIFPAYGEERRRGFSLRNGGYFFDISEYIKLAITGDIYSKGGHALYVNSNYAQRYHYTGSFNFSYSKTRLSDKIEDTQANNDYRLTWSHSPQSKGTGRFSASVNAATSTYNKNNNLMLGNNTDINSTGLNNTTARLSSNVAYNKTFAGTPFSMGINLSHNQDLQTRLVDLPLPNITLNMTNLYPFQRKDGTPGSLDNFSIGYSMTATNRITNNLGRLTPEATRDSIAAFNFENLPLFFDNARKGIRHAPQISYSTKFLKHFTLSPSISYDERWYFERQTWDTVTVSNAMSYKSTTTKEFNRIANYSFGAGVTTRFYGTFFFKNGRVKALRHIVNPTISFNYTPDFKTNTDYFNKLVDRAGNDIYKSRHEGEKFVYGGSNLGRSGALGFGVTNNLEMKVKSEKDTIARKVMLLNNFSINSGYDLIADSFNLSQIAIAANTDIMDNLININFSGSIDPYRYRTRYGENNIPLRETRENLFTWKKDPFNPNAKRTLGRLTSANLAFGTNLNPKARKEQKKTRDKVTQSNLPENEKQVILSNPNSYIDFDIPWSMNIRYNLTYSNGLKTYANGIGTKATVSQTVQFSGDLALSEKWKISYNSGYHIEMKQFTQTDLRISRDLHCWVMNFSWVPFGRYTSYYFTINVKSSLLQDLKLERRKPFFDNL